MKIGNSYNIRPCPTEFVNITHISSVLHPWKCCVAKPDPNNPTDGRKEEEQIKTADCQLAVENTLRQDVHPNLSQEHQGPLFSPPLPAWPAIEATTGPEVERTTNVGSHNHYSLAPNNPPDDCCMRYATFPVTQAQNKVVAMLNWPLM